MLKRILFAIVAVVSYISGVICGWTYGVFKACICGFIYGRKYRGEDPKWIYEKMMAEFNDIKIRDLLRSH